MQTIQDLFNFILHQDRCVVFGNLGRYPHIVFEMLSSVPLLRVIIVSNRCTASSTENRIRVQRPSDPIDRCDLLLYLEPASLELVDKHPLASRVVVFASHFTFKLRDGGHRWIYVSYFHGPDATRTKELLALQDFPIQTNNVGLVEVDHANVLTLSGRTTFTPKESGSYVIVDLTQFNRDTLTMYLAFWDAFDYMLENKSFIDRWVVCFSEKGREAFTRFTQKVIDALFCKTFEHGNVKDHSSILALLPFYKSGMLDQTFDLQISSFGGNEFVAPKTIEDACKAAAMHNVLPLAKNVLWIHN